MSTRSLKLTLGGLAVVALTAAGCGGSYKSPTAPTPAPGAGANVTITIVSVNGSQSFSPNPANVQVGQTVAWYNADLATHDVVADGASFNAGSIPYFGTSTPIMMSTAGSFGYHSQGSPGMVGTLNVTQ